MTSPSMAPFLSKLLENRRSRVLAIAAALTVFGVIALVAVFAIRGESSLTEKQTNTTPVPPLVAVTETPEPTKETLALPPLKDPAPTNEAPRPTPVKPGPATKSPSVDVLATPEAPTLPETLTLPGMPFQLPLLGTPMPGDLTPAEPAPVVPAPDLECPPTGICEQRLTDNLTDDYAPSWSPDGEKIVFDSSRDGNYEIYVMNANGSNPTRVTDDWDDDKSPSWSPDGEKIAFYSERDGSRDIYVVSNFTLPEPPADISTILNIPLKIHLLTDMPMKLKDAAGSDFCVVTPPDEPLPPRDATSTPHLIAGKAKIDGQAAAPGTQITAYISPYQEPVGTGTVEGSSYSVKVVQPGSLAGRTITFKIGEHTANETVVFTAIGATELDLTNAANEVCSMMESWVSEEQIRDVIMPEVNRIYSQANISWEIEELVVEPAATRDYETAADWLSASDRSSPNPQRIRHYFDLIPSATVDDSMVNLYFSTFTGNTRQGRANNCSTNLSFGLDEEPFNMSAPPVACSLTVGGQWSNKYLNDGAVPEKRTISAPEGTPSLAMTVAHELGHNLGLGHPESNESNLMNGSSSGHSLTDDQISTAREYATEHH